MGVDLDPLILSHIHSDLTSLPSDLLAPVSLSAASSALTISFEDAIRETKRYIKVSTLFFLGIFALFSIILGFQGGLGNQLTLVPRAAVVIF